MVYNRVLGDKNMIFGPPTLLLTLQSTPLGVTLHDVIEVTIFYPAV